MATHESDERIIDFRTAVARLRGLPVEAPQEPTLQSHVPGWERSRVALGRRPRGVIKYVWTMHKIIQALGGDATTHADLNKRSVRHYIEDEAAVGRAASTRINDLAVIRSFCRWAILEDYRTDDPTAGIMRPHKPVEAPRALTDDDLAQLVAAIDAMPADLNAADTWYWKRNRLAIILMLLTGLRISEVADLRWRDINLAKRTLVVRCGKGGKAGAVPLNSELIAELLAVPEAERQPTRAVIARYGKHAGEAMTYKGMERICSRWLVEDVGIAAVSAHRLRHTFATQLLYNDVDVRRIQRLLRHTNLSSTQRYLTLRDADLESAVETLTLRKEDTSAS